MYRVSVNRGRLKLAVKRCEANLYECNLTNTYLWQRKLKVGVRLANEKISERLLEGETLVTPLEQKHEEIVWVKCCNEEVRRLLVKP